MPQKIALILRPGIGDERLEEFREAVKDLRAQGHEVAPRPGFEKGDGRRLALSAARSGFDLVVAAGGDGTLNEVANGITSADEWPRLGMVPLGTANDFATGLECPESIRDALRVAVDGRALPVDVARVNDRRFLNVSTGGFGAEATDSAPSDTKRRLGPLAYIITGMREFVDLEPVPGRFQAGADVLYDGPFLLFAVGNARRTGGGSMLTPRAELTDGLLDVLIVPALPRMDFAALLPDLRAGTHLNSPDVIYAQVPALRIDADRDLHVNADGEPLCARRFEYGLLERRLEVMVRP